MHMKMEIFIIRSGSIREKKIWIKIHKKRNQMNLKKRMKIKISHNDKIKNVHIGVFNNILYFIYRH